MEEKNIDKLYELLENKQLDEKIKIALRWAIFELERRFKDVQ